MATLKKKQFQEISENVKSKRGVARQISSFLINKISKVA